MIPQSNIIIIPSNACSPASPIANHATFPKVAARFGGSTSFGINARQWHKRCTEYRFQAAMSNSPKVFKKRPPCAAANGNASVPVPMQVFMRLIIVSRWVAWPFCWCRSCCWWMCVSGRRLVASVVVLVAIAAAVAVTVTVMILIRLSGMVKSMLLLYYFALW